MFLIASFGNLHADTGAPAVEILSLTDSQTVTAPTHVLANIQSPLLANWRLAYRSIDSVNEDAEEGSELIDPAQWTVLSTAGTNVDHTIIAKFDPTLLLNGIYEVRLEATDTLGRLSAVNLTVLVDKNLKLGHFQAAFDDLTINIKGVGSW